MEQEEFSRLNNEALKYITEYQKTGDYCWLYKRLKPITNDMHKIIHGYPELYEEYIDLCNALYRIEMGLTGYIIKREDSYHTSLMRLHRKIIEYSSTRRCYKGLVIYTPISGNKNINYVKIGEGRLHFSTYKKDGNKIKLRYIDNSPSRFIVFKNRMKSKYGFKDIGDDELYDIFNDVQGIFYEWNGEGIIHEEELLNELDNLRDLDWFLCYKQDSNIQLSLETRVLTIAYFLYDILRIPPIKIVNFVRRVVGNPIPP